MNIRSRVLVGGVTLLFGTGLTLAGLVSASATGKTPQFNAHHDPGVPAGTCFLSVPAHPLTIKGLATPYILSGTAAQSDNPGGCTEASPNTGILVQAAILAPDGKAYVYDPLVITQGTAPQVAPVVPVIPQGSKVAIWVGSDDVNTQLIGDGASRFINGADGSNFGQMAYSKSAIKFFADATADIKAGKLVVPPLGVQSDGVACPTVSSFEVGDQDPQDNNPTTGLTNGTLVAQNTAANRAAFPGDYVFTTGSDNELLDGFIDPALNSEGGSCHPWEIPSLDDPGAYEPTLAFDQLQAAFEQSDPLVTEVSDEMTLAGSGVVNGISYLGLHESQVKTHAYQQGVDGNTNANDSEATYCQGLDSIFPPFLVANKAAFEAAPSLQAGQNLANFLAQRFADATWPMPLPFPGLLPTCTQVLGGTPDPVIITSVDGNGNATSFTVNGSTTPPTTTTTSPTTTTTIPTTTTTVPVTTTTTVPVTTTTIPVTITTAPTTTTTVPVTGSKPSSNNTGPVTGTTFLTLDYATPAETLPAANTSPAGCATWDPGNGLSTSVDSCTVRSVNMTGDYAVDHNNVTITNSLIHGLGTENSNEVVIQSNWGTGNFTGFVISHSTIDDPSGGLYCVAGFNFTLTADNLSGCVHLINLYGQTDNVTVTASYFHDQKALSSDHVELIYASPGASNINLQGNNFDVAPIGGVTADLFLDGVNQDTHWTVNGNYFDGTVPGTSNWGSIQMDTSGVTFINNEIGLNSTYGPYLTNDATFSVATGNTWMYSGTTPTSWSNGGGVKVTGGTEISGI